MIERLHGQFFNEPTDAFHLNAVEQNQDKYAQRHRQRNVYVSRWNNTQRW